MVDSNPFRSSWSKGITLFLLMVLIIVAVFCLFLGWMGISKGLYLAACLLFLGVGCGPFPKWVLCYLQSPYVIKPKIDVGKRYAVVVLGGGTTKVAQANGVEPGLIAYSRILEAARIYRECVKTGEDCKIILSGGDPNQNGRSEAQVYADALHLIGIPEKDILRESRSLNTWQNAQLTSQVLHEYNPGTALLISSAIHLRRSVLYFAHFGVNVVPVRSDYLTAMLAPFPLAYNFMMSDLALHEWFGIVRYRIYNVLGFNPARKKPGDA